MINKIKIMHIFLLIIGLNLLTACAVKPQIRNPENTAEYESKIVYKSVGLKIWLGLIDYKISKINGLLNVKVKFKSNYLGDRKFRAKIKFLDKDGYELEDPYEWEIVFFDKGEYITFERTAYDPKAVDFRVIVDKTR